MKDNDGILALLQDIKDILYGIALLLTGGLMCVAGILLGGWGILLSAVGFFVLLAGLNNVYQGSPPYSRRKTGLNGGSHAF